MSLKHIIHKAARSAKKHIKRLGNPKKDWSGRKTSALNPFSTAVGAARKVVRGTRGNIKGKVTRALGYKATSVPYSYTVAGSSGGEYVHNARTLSQMTGGH